MIHGTQEIIGLGLATKIRAILDEVDETKDVLADLIYGMGRTRMAWCLEEYLTTPPDELSVEIQNLIKELKNE